MKRTALVAATVAVFALILGTADLGSGSQANAAGHVTLVRHGHYGYHHGLRYGHSLRPYVGYHHGWGHGYGYGYPRARVYTHGAYYYPHRTYYRAPYVAYPHHGYLHGYSCY